MSNNGDCYIQPDFMRDKKQTQPTPRMAQAPRAPVPQRSPHDPTLLRPPPRAPVVRREEAVEEYQDDYYDPPKSKSLLEMAQEHKIVVLIFAVILILLIILIVWLMMRDTKKSALVTGGHGPPHEVRSRAAPDPEQQATAQATQVATKLGPQTPAEPEKSEKPEKSERSQKTGKTRDSSDPPGQADSGPAPPSHEQVWRTTTDEEFDKYINLDEGDLNGAGARGSQKSVGSAGPTGDDEELRDAKLDDIDS
jgi:hypothetical protein